MKLIYKLLDKTCPICKNKLVDIQSYFFFKGVK